MSDQTTRREFFTAAAATAAAALAPGLANASPITISNDGSSLTARGTVFTTQKKNESKPLEYRAWADLTEVERFDIFWRYFTSEGRKFDQLEAASGLGFYDAAFRAEKIFELLSSTTDPGRQQDELPLYRWAFDDRRAIERGACTPWLVASKEPHCPKCNSDDIRFEFYPDPSDSTYCVGGSSTGFHPKKTHDFWTCEKCGETTMTRNIAELKTAALERLQALGTTHEEIENTFASVMGRRRSSEKYHSRHTNLCNWLSSYTPLLGKNLLAPTFDFERRKSCVAFFPSNFSDGSGELEIPEPVASYVREAEVLAVPVKNVYCVRT